MIPNVGLPPCSEPFGRSKRRPYSVGAMHVENLEDPSSDALAVLLQLDANPVGAPLGAPGKRRKAVPRERPCGVYSF